MATAGAGWKQLLLLSCPCSRSPGHSADTDHCCICFNRTVNFQNVSALQTSQQLRFRRELEHLAFYSSRVFVRRNERTTLTET